MMQKRSIALTVLASFFVCGTALAAQRDITSRLGGKANDIFKITGGFLAKTLQLSGNLRVDGKIYSGATGASDTKPVVINDNLQVKGRITTNGLTVDGTKRYSGTFDTSLDGDFVSTLTFGYDCTVPANATYMKTQAIHYKAITIPEVTLSSLPDVRMFYRTQTATLYGTPASSYTPTVFPNNNDNWVPLTTYLNEGKAYFTFKTVTTQCNGTVTNTINTTGEYQVVIH
jgi:hypothetical protein